MVSAIIATAVSGGCTFFSTPDGETAQNQMQRTKKNVRKEVAFVPLSQVQLTAGPLYQRQKLNNNYIVYTIHPDRMLAPFMLRAGQQPKEPRYDGWEDGQLSGHAMGHYLSALAYVYDISKDEALRAEAKKKADDILAKYNKNKTEDNFITLAKENSEDGSASDGGLIENFTKNSVVAEFGDWSFDAARKAGDTAIVKSTYGYHVMYFVSVGDAEWKVNATADYKSAEYQKKYDAFAEKFTVTANDKNIEKIADYIK